MNVKLAHFDLLEEIGHGGLGVVFRAFDPSLNRYVAIKVLKDEFAEDPEFVQGFLRESQNAAAISHPHIVQIYFIGEFEGNCYMVMELVNGRSLEQIVQQEGPMPEAKALRVAIEITEALKAAYVNQMVHGDIKPQNILVSEESGAKLLDFGLAQLANVEVHDSSEGVWGSPYYISPERVGRKAEDFRSDIYSLGATIFEALVGHPPFEAADPTELAIKRLSEKPPLLRTLNPNISKRTEQIINKMLHKNLLMRYLDYDSLLNELRKAESAALGKEPLTDTMEMRRLTGYITAPVPVPTQRSLLPMILGVSLASCAVVGGGIYFLIGKKAQVQAPVHASPTPQATAAGPTPLPLKYGSKIVRLLYFDSTHSAKQVSLVGNFDLWQPEPMTEDSRNPGYWAIQKEIPLGVAIEYQFVVDGKAIPDPGKPNSKFPDGKGSFKTIWDFSATATPKSSPVATPAPAATSTPAPKPSPVSTPAPAATPKAAVTPAEKKPAEATATPRAPFPHVRVVTVDASMPFAQIAENCERRLLGFEPGEAKRDALAFLTPTTPSEGLQKALLEKKIAAMADFKKKLEEEIPKIGYPFPVDTKEAKRVPGGITQLFPAGVIVNSPEGEVKLRLNQLMPETLLEMSAYYAMKETDPDQLAQRNWNAGVAAFCMNLKTEGKALMEKAVKQKPALKKEMESILGH